MMSVVLAVIGLGVIAAQVWLWLEVRSLTRLTRMIVAEPPDLDLVPSGWPRWRSSSPAAAPDSDVRLALGDLLTVRPDDTDRAAV